MLESKIYKTILHNNSDKNSVCVYFAQGGYLIRNVLFNMVDADKAMYQIVKHNDISPNDKVIIQQLM